MRVPLWSASAAGVLLFLFGVVVGIVNGYSDAAMVTRMNIFKLEQQQSDSLQQIVRLLSRNEVVK